MTSTANPLIFSFNLVNNSYHNALLTRAIILLKNRTLIEGIKSDISFVKSIDKDDQEENFYKNAYAQIEYYKKALEDNSEYKAVNAEIENTYHAKKTLLYSIYDDLNHLKTRWLEILNHKKQTIHIAREHDLNDYVTIDKRQNITKSSLSLFLKRTWLKGLCSKNEYRKALKHNVYSDNLRGRINNFLQHKVNKTGHKKQYVYLSAYRRKNKDTYEYNEQHNLLIKYRGYAEYFKPSFIEGEINKKIHAESKVYAYCKITR